MFSFLPDIILYHAIGIGLYLLYRKKMVAALKLNEKYRKVPVLVSKKNWWFFSHKPSRLEKATILC